MNNRSIADRDYERRNLRDVANAVKSSNAGASWLTLDIFCSTLEDLNRISTNLEAKRVAQCYHVHADDVQIYVYECALAIKVTVPRHNITGSGVAAGDIWETDFDGVQQHVPLLDLSI